MAGTDTDVLTAGLDRLDITTNNPATQVYTAYYLGLLGIPRKRVHGGPLLNYTSFGGVALEQEGYIDAINTPEWNVDQICACAWFILRSPCEMAFLTRRGGCRRAWQGLHLELDVPVLDCAVTRAGVPGDLLSDVWTVGGRLWRGCLVWARDGSHRDTFILSLRGAGAVRRRGA